MLWEEPGNPAPATAAALADLLGGAGAGVLNGQYSLLTNALVVDNRNSRNQWSWFELLATWAVAPTAASTIDIYFVPAMDLTNYVTCSATLTPGLGRRIGQIDLLASTAAQRRVSDICELPPLLGKLVIGNASGQTTPAGFVLSGVSSNDVIQ